MGVARLFDLTGSITLMTGASRGIGFTVARHMLACGADVAINGELGFGEYHSAYKESL
jgi:NAD(P)-dependent dehydrogenase (short-subunit alcohol dehydrogenase family)